MSGNDHIQQIQIYILPIDLRRLFEGSPEIKKEFYIFLFIGKQMEINKKY